MPLRLFNSLTRRVEDFVPADPARVTFYTCGPTVYDDAHIGNFRSFLAADVLRRFLQSPLCEVVDGRGGGGGEKGAVRGPRDVIHVMNITDVGHMTDDAEGGEHGEDRMAVAGRRIAEAKKSGKLPEGTRIDPGDPYQIARFYEDRFKGDARKLGLRLVADADADPARMPRATEHVGGMIAVIARLIDRGHAYVVGPPGERVVYFRVQSFEAYGRLSGNTLDKLRAGEGGRVSDEHQATKEHPADFLLWKEDPRHIMKWPSPWGEGYPGWHIECTVMSVTGTRGGGGGGGARGSGDDGLAGFVVPDAAAIIDLHSGGEDNIFPHHECEIAQSCCAFNASPRGGTFARLWFHPRFLLVEGTKMSKSKGNFFTARDLFAKGVEPAALRLELIKTHYRSNANFTMQGLVDSQRMVERWRRVGDMVRAGNGQMVNEEVQGEFGKAGGAAVLAEFAAAMHEDLNVAAAIAAVNAWVGSITSPTPQDAAAMAVIDGVLGVLSLERPAATQTAIGVFAPGIEPDPRVEELLHKRAAARAAKDFKASDAIRDELAKLGYAIMDRPGGKVEVRRA